MVSKMHPALLRNANKLDVGRVLCVPFLWARAVSAAFLAGPGVRSSEFRTLGSRE